MTNPTTLRRALDMVAPRVCPGCGNRLATSEDVVCGACLLRLPRTMHWLRPTDNDLAKLFYGLVGVERVAALFHYEPHAHSSQLIYELKYRGRPDIGAALGRMAAIEMSASGFFNGITAIVPMPLARKRQRQRGYNQSDAIAHGVASATGIAICRNAIRRTTYEASQTTLHRQQRMDNVANAFALHKPHRLAGRHILLIDDVITTGATVMACASVLATIPGIKISIMSLGFTDS